MTHRLVHDLGCDFESEIVGTEQPCVVVNAQTKKQREAYCGCGANPALAKETHD